MNIGAVEKVQAHLQATYTGRPTPVSYARRLSEQLGGAQIYLKREDLAHSGAHKINNALGQALLAKRMGKGRIIAPRGAGRFLRPDRVVHSPCKGATTAFHRGGGGIRELLGELPARREPLGSGTTPSDRRRRCLDRPTRWVGEDLRRR